MDVSHPLDTSRSTPVVFVVLGDTDRVWFTWQAWGGGAAPESRGQDLPSAPADFQMDSWQVKAKSVWDTGGASVKTHLRRGNEHYPTVKREEEHRQLRLTCICNIVLNVLGQNMVLLRTVQHRVPTVTWQHMGKECKT